MATTVMGGDTTEKDETRVHGGVYFDLGYLLSSNDPANRTWRSKGTSWLLDGLELNNATAFAEKEASVDSRWGFQVGLQDGRDVDNLVSDTADAPDELKYLYYTNVTYLFPLGRGLSVQGGLIPGHIGYESFHAINNPNYTRVYGVDNVPYFEWGVWATYPLEGTLSASLLVVNGWDYLASPNDVPSYGLQLVWQARDDVKLIQNLYYGPDQAETSLEFWRFVTETILEWGVGEFLFVGDIGYGTEQQAAIPGAPQFDWLWGAAWATWQAEARWNLAARAEFFRDADGLITGYRQTIRALTGTVEFRASSRAANPLSLRLEYRYDRSVGGEAGFFEGPTNRLVPDQHLLIASLLWRYDTAPGR